VAYDRSQLHGGAAFENNRNGLEVFLYRRFGLSPSLYIQPEIGYAKKGAELIWLDPNTLIALDYLQGQVMLKRYLANTPGTGPYLEAGPYVAYNIVAQVKRKIGEHTTARDFDEHKSLDFGFVLGGGVDFGCGKFKVVSDVRYELGMAKVLENNVSGDGWELVEGGEVPNLKNRTLALSMGIVF